MDVKKVTSWVMLALYSILLLSLIRPGGTGQQAVSQFGEAFAGLVVGV